MPIIELGRRPDILRVMLRRGDPFDCVIKLADPDDAYNEPPVLVFPLPVGEDRWAAELLDPVSARFSMDATKVTELIENSVSRVARVEYEGITWFAGKFEVLGPR